VTGIQDLFEYIETLASRLREAEDELRDKKDVVKLTRSRVEEAEKHVQECQNEKVGVFVTQPHDYHPID
jgi:chromosome segregation ATPase